MDLWSLLSRRGKGNRQVRSGSVPVARGLPKRGGDGGEGKKVWKTLAVVVGAYLGVASAVSFTLFIYEESLQTVMFAVWQVKDAPLTLHAQVYRTLLDQAKLITRLVGWINPLAYLSYNAYWKAAEMYYLSAFRKEVTR